MWQSVAFDDAQSIPLIQLFARGDPPHGDDVHPLSSVAATGRRSLVRARYRHLPRNSSVLMFRPPRYCFGEELGVGGAGIDCLFRRMSRAALPFGHLHHPSNISTESDRDRRQTHERTIPGRVRVGASPIARPSIMPRTRLMLTGRSVAGTGRAVTADQDSLIVPRSIRDLRRISLVSTMA